MTWFDIYRDYLYDHLKITVGGVHISDEGAKEDFIESHIAYLEELLDRTGETGKAVDLCLSRMNKEEIIKNIDGFIYLLEEADRARAKLGE